MASEEIDAIWAGDRLGRQHEALTIERFLVAEVQVFKNLGRDQSIVLGIDAPYGRGKTWFLTRLAKQLALSHPVAWIDAWADDVGDEPLTAFMSAIDDALEPFLSKSKKLKDRMAAAKAAALPVMGKMLSGALVKSLSKLAGDEIQENVGDAFEEAVRGVKLKDSKGEQGAAAKAMESAIDAIGAEIDSLVDRRGAAMLAAYRQRKKSRQAFMENMRGLIAAMNEVKGTASPPLIVVIDELDRCRPNYALRMLEEIKHFFEVPGVVFIIGLHGGQLEKSVKAIYGAEFDSIDYLRRFFTRRYDLRGQSIVELAAEVFEQWNIDGKKFQYAELDLSNYPLTNGRYFGIVLAQLRVTPREIYAVMDGLRLFTQGWEHPEPIEPIALTSLLVHMVRGEPLNFLQQNTLYDVKLKGLSYNPDSGNGQYEKYELARYLAVLQEFAWLPLAQISQLQIGSDAVHNQIVEWIHSELRQRRLREPQSRPHQSHFVEYIPRIVELARFIEIPNIEPA